MRFRSVLWTAVVLFGWALASSPAQAQSTFDAQQALNQLGQLHADLLNSPPIGATPGGSLTSANVNQNRLRIRAMVALCERARRAVAAGQYQLAYNAMLSLRARLTPRTWLADVAGTNLNTLVSGQVYELTTSLASAPGVAIPSFEVEPLSTVGGTTTSLSVSISLQRTLQPNGTITMTFPQGYDASSAQVISPVGGIVTFQWNGNGTGTFTVHATATAGTRYTVLIGPVVNPPVPGPSGSLAAFHASTSAGDGLDANAYFTPSSITKAGNNPADINENDVVTLASPALRFTTNPGSHITHTATVNWADGGIPGSNPYPNPDIQSATVTESNGSGSVTVPTHRYMENRPSDAAYSIVITLRDNLGGTQQVTYSLTVHNVAPTIITVTANKTLNEGDTLTLSSVTPAAVFTDPGTLDTHTVTIDWGEGAGPQAGTVTETNGSGYVTGSHQYLNVGVHTVNIVVTDEDNASSNTGSFTVTVDNVTPVVAVAHQTVTVSESQQNQFNNTTLATFTDPGSSVESYSAGVIWGDNGNAIDTTNVSVQGSSVIGTHHYTAVGVTTVTVMVTDSNSATGQASFTVTVQNVTPSSLQLTMSSQSINEGQTLNVSGQFNDPGVPPETWNASVHWGDGTPDTTVPYNKKSSPSGGVGAFGVNSAGPVTHTYYATGTFNVSFTVTDQSGASATSASQTLTVTNLAPTVTVTPPAAVTSGTATILNWSVSDPGSAASGASPGEAYTYTIAWGDGRSDQQSTFSTTSSASHTYAAAGTYAITVTATDNGTAPQTGTGTASAVVNPPVVITAFSVTAQGPPQPPHTVNANVTFTDSGSNGQYKITVNWGDGGPASIVSGIMNPGPQPPISHTYAATGNYTVSVAVTYPSPSYPTSAPSGPGVVNPQSVMVP